MPHDPAKISAVLLANRPPTAPNLVPELQAAGIPVGGALDSGKKLVQGVVLHRPDLLICDVAAPGPALWQSLQALEQTQPCPVLLFTNSQDAEAIARATAAGVHVYVVPGYGVNRSRALIRHALPARKNNTWPLRRSTLIFATFRANAQRLIG